jgi:GT2 family glycosyltransferase
LVAVVVPLYGDYEEEFAPVKAALAEMEDIYGIYPEDTEGAGFTVTVNRGIRTALTIDDVEAVWILNQDAVPLPGAQTALLERLRSAPEVGIAASMQIHPDDDDFITYGGSGPVIPGVHWTGHVSEGQHLEPKKMGWANGASMMVKTEVFREIGLLDERLKMLASDSDFSFRARAAGYEVWYEPESRVVHELRFSANPPDERKWEAREDAIAFQGKWGGDLFNELAKEVFD